MKRTRTEAWRLALVAFIGFKDWCGVELRKRRVLEARFRETGYCAGFDEIETPVIESIEGISDAILRLYGRMNFFGFVIEDRDTDETKTTGVILRPEGTLPVVRYVAERLLRNEAIPQKLFYDLVCYRNERIETLDSEKLREFRQLGVEYLGREDAGADAEVIRFGLDFLKRLGLEGRARINSVRIFRKLCDAGGLAEQERLDLQDRLDGYSKQRSLGRKAAIILPDALRPLLDEPTPERLAALDGDLAAIVGELRREGYDARADLTVVRGLLYYTGPVWQFDVRGKDGWIAEAGGGGRYDGLFSQYLRLFGVEAGVPATGFAFGTQRLLKAITEAGR